jgi:hypothetical protein
MPNSRASAKQYQRTANIIATWSNRDMSALRLGWIKFFKLRDLLKSRLTAALDRFIEIVCAAPAKGVQYQHI